MSNCGLVWLCEHPIQEIYCYWVMLLLISIVALWSLFKNFIVTLLWLIIVILLLWIFLLYCFGLYLTDLCYIVAVDSLLLRTVFKSFIATFVLLIFIVRFYCYIRVINWYCYIVLNSLCSSYVNCCWWCVIYQAYSTFILPPCTNYIFGMQIVNLLVTEIISLSGKT